MTDGADDGEQALRAAALLGAFFEARAGGDADFKGLRYLWYLVRRPGTDIDGVRTGWACRYDPDPARPVTWVLESTGSPQATV